MQHPGCWVTNGGCATQSEHRVAPAAMAYSALERQAGSLAPHPGEGTRTGAAPAATAPPEPIPFRPAQRPADQPTSAEADDGPVIGAVSPAPMIHRTLPSTVGVPAAPRRYQPPPGDQMPRRQMPKIYDRHPIFGYWYVPAAILVAIFVAWSVIWVGGKLFGDDSAPADSATPAPTQPSGGQATQEPATPAPTTAGSQQTPLPSTGPGKFKGGDVLIVTGTGDCLNVRVKAGRENDAIVCVKDGTELRVTGGPETASELTWWKVQTELGEGWAAEDYLVKK
jgi:hypothetical protein